MSFVNDNAQVKTPASSIACAAPWVTYGKMDGKKHPLAQIMSDLPIASMKNLT
jgi:hypothetical protein